MKLQSRDTVKFDPVELQKLAKRTRPRKKRGPMFWAAVGAALGATIVAALRSFH